MIAMAAIVAMAIVFLRAYKPYLKHEWINQSYRVSKHDRSLYHVTAHPPL